MSKGKNHIKRCACIHGIAIQIRIASHVRIKRIGVCLQKYASSVPHTVHEVNMPAITRFQSKSPPPEEEFCNFSGGGDFDGWNFPLHFRRIGFADPIFQGE